jgi:hypothetical protein
MRQFGITKQTLLRQGFTFQRSSICVSGFYSQEALQQGRIVGTLQFIDQGKAKDSPEDLVLSWTPSREFIER